MEILISANQGVLSIVTAKEITVTDTMCREDFKKWVEAVKGDESADEDRLQEVSI